MEVKEEKHKPMENTNHLAEQSNASKETNENDDPVVHEIPVFLAQSLAKQLFMFQVNHICFSRINTKVYDTHLHLPQIQPYSSILTFCSTPCDHVQCLMILLKLYHQNSKRSNTKLKLLWRLIPTQQIMMFRQVKKY